MPRMCFNLILDHDTEQAVRDIWRRIADAGITVKGLQTGYHPHISLAAYEVIDIAPYETALNTVVTAMPPFPIRMESLGIFPEAGVVFLAPRMSHALFSIHRAVIYALDERGKPPIADERLLPDLWMPHCTLTGGLTLSQLLTAIEVCQQSWTPIRGQVKGIGMRIFPAPIDHHCYSFSHV